MHNQHCFERVQTKMAAQLRAKHTNRYTLISSLTLIDALKNALAFSGSIFNTRTY